MTIVKMTTIKKILYGLLVSLLLPLSQIWAMQVSTQGSYITRLFNAATQTKARTVLSLSTVLAIAWLAHHYLKPKSPLSSTNTTNSTTTASAPTIVDYDKARDFKDTIKLFQANWQDLCRDSDFDIDSEQLLYLKIPQSETRRIKVIHDDNNTVIGFVSYYTYHGKDHRQQDILYGKIHHLIVARKFRQRGLGTLLLRCATNDLKSMGAITIILSVISTSIMSFFEKKGFKKSKTFHLLNHRGIPVPISYTLMKPLPYIAHLDDKVTPPS